MEMDMHPEATTAAVVSASCPARSAIAEIIPPELAYMTLVLTNVAAQWLKGTLHNHVATLPQTLVLPPGVALLEVNAVQRTAAAKAITSSTLVCVNIAMHANGRRRLMCTGCQGMPGTSLNGM
jgi:hypothetical protein